MYGVYCRLGLHVSTSNVDVIKAVSKRMVPFKSESRDERKSIFKIMLDYHQKAQQLSTF